MADSVCIAGPFEVKLGTMKVPVMEGAELYPDHYTKADIVDASGTRRSTKKWVPTVFSGTVRMDPEIDWQAVADYEGPVKVRKLTTGQVWLIRDGEVIDGFRENLTEATAPFEIHGGKCIPVNKAA